MGISNAGGPCLKLESLNNVAMKRLHLPLNMAGATISFYGYFSLQSIVRNVVAYATMCSCCTHHRPSVTSMPPSNLALRQEVHIEVTSCSPERQSNKLLREVG